MAKKPKSARKKSLKVKDLQAKGGTEWSIKGGALDGSAKDPAVSFRKTK